MSITSSLVVTMLLAAVGASMDGGRLITTKAKLQSISDVAALAAATPQNMDEKARRQVALSSIQIQLKNRWDLDLVSQDVFVRDSGREVDVKLSAKVPLLFGMVMGGNDRHVVASSTAGEITSRGSQNGMSISIILDLSSSMNERFDTGSRLANVKAALSDTLTNIQNFYGGEALAAAQVSTGLYSFHWGPVTTETTELAPGMTHVRDALINMPTSEGSVASASMEQAVQDQFASANSANQFMVYFTDGGVDDEKADQYGRYLSETNQISVESSPACETRMNELDALKTSLAGIYNQAAAQWWAFGLEDNIRPEDDDFIMHVERLLDRHLDGRGWRDANGNSIDHPMVTQLDRVKTSYDQVSEEVNELCVFEQTARVVSTCEKARDGGVSMIAINLARKDEDAEEVTQRCALFGMDPDFDVADDVQRRLAVENLPKRRLPSGFEVTLSEDGESMYAQVSSLEQMREVLATMMPEAGEQGERMVRLIR